MQVFTKYVVMYVRIYVHKYVCSYVAYMQEVFIHECIVWHSSKIRSHSIDILECESSACQVNLLISINDTYSVETGAQQKIITCKAIA